MSISSKIGSLAGKVVTGSKAAPKRTKRKLSTLKNELATGPRVTARSDQDCWWSGEDKVATPPMQK